MAKKIKEIKFYGYERCGTCIKAKKFLDQKGYEYTFIPIREKPPTQKLLKEAHRFLMSGGINEAGEKPKDSLYCLKRLFNTAGKDYREGDWKEKVKSMSSEKLIQALSKNGNLIKRPLVQVVKGSASVSSEDMFVVGFKEEEWQAVFKK